MKKKTFPTFNDGIVYIYTVENDAENGDSLKEKLILYNKYNFGINSIGITRQFLAMQNDVEIKKLIRIPTTDPKINNQMIAVINQNQYQIKQIQLIDNAMLNHLLLTLTDVEENYDTSRF